MLRSEGSRRQFLTRSVSALALAASSAGSAAFAAMGPNDKFDLRHQGRRRARPEPEPAGHRDIGIRYGVIEAVEADIPADRALKVMNAAGKLVTPGLIDLHAHVYPYGSAIGIPGRRAGGVSRDHHSVSAGDAGANNFAAFRRAHRQAQTRTRALRLRPHRQYWPCGFPVPELYNIDLPRSTPRRKR